MAKSYEVHVRVQRNGANIWLPISPSGENSVPYRFRTEQAARWHLIDAYGHLDGNGEIIRKIVEVNEPSNISLE